MPRIERRTFLGAALAALPFALADQPLHASNESKVAMVPSGEDRLGKNHIVGVSVSSFKVSGENSHGGLFIMEHLNHKKGGPPRHMHHYEDEWFYVVEGDYVVEIGSERMRLKSGDSILAPREIPHGWAFVGDTPGRVLIAFAPANKMEEFISKMPPPGSTGSTYSSDAAFYRAYGIDLLGPPISLG
jgi:quercetin dioxygenase-like cupin family protein